MLPSQEAQSERYAVANCKNFLRTGAVVLGLLLTAVAVPAAAQTRADQGMTTDRDDHGFDDWGLLGLLGLAGLLGRKRDRTVVDTRRV
jgi:MYXO-CTERM domain-containing protein